MKKRSESKRKTAAQVDDLFTSAQPDLESTLLAPDIPERVSGLVERVFSIEDPNALYGELENALNKRNEALTPGVLSKLLSDSPRLYREAHRLYIDARISMEAFERHTAPVEAALRGAATKELQKEKEDGKRSKAITDADVTARMHDMFPDEMTAIGERRVKMKLTIEHLNHMVDVFKARGFALKALYGGKEEL